MKKLALLTLLGLLTFSTYAQKFGHLNAQELISIMPERDKAVSELQDYAKGLESQLMSMQSEYQSMIEDLTKQDKIAEIQGLEQRITTFQQSAQTSLQNKEIELLQPIEEKATDAINAVAEKGKYTYILDSSSGILLYSKDSENILDKVKKELGL